jgi:hypothetical protein
LSLEFGLPRGKVPLEERKFGFRILQFAVCQWVFSTDRSESVPYHLIETLARWAELPEMKNPESFALRVFL